MLFTGYTAGKAQENEFQRQMVVLIALIALPTAVIFSAINFLHHYLLLGFIELLASALLILSIIIVKNPDGLKLSKNLLMINALMVFSALFADGGIGETGAIWTMIVPVLAILLMGLPVAWYWIGTFIIIISTTITLHVIGIYTLPYDDTLLLHYPAAFIFFSLIAAAIEAQLERLHVKHEETIQELQDLQGNLKHAVKQRTAALQKANDKLQSEIKHHKKTSEALSKSEERFFQAQKMESIGTLVGGFAHDFNNMLAGIIANLFMLKRKVADDPDLTKRIDNTNQLASSAADMIKQLLTFARKDTVEYKSFDLIPFMNEAYKLASISISPRVKLTYDFTSEPLWVQANATQIQQVLMNLLNNARDAVKPEQDATIHVTLSPFESDEKFRIKHPDLSSRYFARLSVKDNGSGIEDGLISKVFEPFFTTKESGSGTGLGLAMCYGAINGHGGTIEVKSSPGNGTTFHVYLPIYNDFADGTLEETLQSMVRGNGECILLVEDDPILAKIIKETLTTLGYFMMQANNGKEAVEVFRQCGDEIKIIIMDVVMPVMGGVEAGKKIREMRSDIEILYITSYDPEGTIDGRNIPGPGDYVLDKPFTIDELSSAVQKKLHKN